MSLNCSLSAGLLGSLLLDLYMWTLHSFWESSDGVGYRSHTAAICIRIRNTPLLKSASSQVISQRLIGRFLNEHLMLHISLTVSISN